MKAWQVALIVVVLVVGAGLVLRSTKTTPKTSQAPRTSNDLFASAFAGALSGLGKLGAPSSAPSGYVSPAYVNPSLQTQYSFDSATTEQVGNELIDKKTGQALDYGPY